MEYFEGNLKNFNKNGDFLTEVSTFFLSEKFPTISTEGANKEMNLGQYLTFPSKALYKPNEE